MKNRVFKGIFWITDLENVRNKPIYVQVSCDCCGTVLETYHIPEVWASKGGNELNHEKVWKTLMKSQTHGHPYNYYPRGRVEIGIRVAKVYHSCVIPQDQLKSWVIDMFDLTPENGIEEVKMIADGSDHYKHLIDL